MAKKDCYYYDNKLRRRRGTHSLIRGDVSFISGDVSNISGDVSNISGYVSNISGYVSKISGDVSNISGYVSNIRGHVSNISGDVSNISGYVSNIRGYVSNISGYVSNISGHVSKISGDVSNIRGDVSNIRGDVCDLVGDIRQLLAHGMLVRKDEPTTLEVFARRFGIERREIPGIGMCYIFYRAVRPDLTSRDGFKYPEYGWVGLRADEEFNEDPSLSCVWGGLYATNLMRAAANPVDREYITVLEVALPLEGVRAVVDPGGDKVRAEKLIVLGRVKPIRADAL